MDIALQSDPNLLQPFDLVNQNRVAIPPGDFAVEGPTNRLADPLSVLAGGETGEETEVEPVFASAALAGPSVQASSSVWSGRNARSWFG